jgi:L-alanine-DL-glutamate epimerase-like enolase superfamily enzyme
MIQITRTNVNFERQPMAAPFGFKGGYVHEQWQSVALLESATGKRGIGQGAQGVLWSDPQVFMRHSEAAGNSLMLLTTAYALRAAQEIPFETPPDLLDRLLPQTYDYARRLTENPDLRLTFALNALVAVDNAAWLLYSAERGITQFDALIPSEARPALAHRYAEVVNIPLVSYGVSLEGILRLVDDGYYLLKIKIGSDPDKDGDQEKMLAWDIARMQAIHSALKERAVPGAPDGHVLYYLDANGRYENKERLLRLLDAIEQMGALKWTVLLEEPFPEELTCDVRDVPVRVAADESAHSDREALERMELGYGAIALKPIAKTLSMSFKIARLAHERGVPCFCADLTVGPILVDWNKTVAARLAPLPGLRCGVLEANGFQNYRNWAQMCSYHPCAGAPWIAAEHGVFHLNEDFYARSGGIFLPSEHYTSLVV